MEILSNKTIKQNIANSDIIFTRGENIYLLGNYSVEEADNRNGVYSYTMNGNYGDYTVNISLGSEKVETQCSCPFPHDGCKHIVAVCLDIAHKQKREQQSDLNNETGNEYLTPEEIRNLALESRKERARKENLVLLQGETYKGRHIVKTEKNREYTVTVHSPAKMTGHCTCLDFTTNHLGVCKHLLFVYNQFKKEKGFLKQSAIEVFPFIHIFWNSRLQAPECYYETIDDPELRGKIDKLFNEKMIYTRDLINQLYKFYHDTDGISVLQFDEYLLQRMENLLYQKEISKLKRKFDPDYSFLNTELYPYQKEGVQFAVFKKDAIIADEMGLGKTLQAITVAELKKHIFGFTKVLVITPASVKDQWKREIDKFSNETSIVVSGGKANRQKIYEEDISFFKITNYEAVMRDILAIIRWSPDFVILDEAQRIKNFETKTHQALLSIPRNHSLVITGTPLENKLVDVYGIVQFSDHTLLTPLWAFAANHF
ncbi:MAG: DEAD/DEAH box helicase family protein, partial [Bacteroidetes bacterium]|nr:DEAD/DEAH box helicase family protein [Bacteroidota bacterium]